MRIYKFSRDGVWVTHALPAVRDTRPALVFVHGGGHASWCWTHLLPFFARAGWECFAFDWFNHGRSARTDPGTFLHRSIAAVTEEIGIVAALTKRPPVLVGHSMGGAACLVYAAQQQVAALVLLAPVVPAGLGAKPVDVPVELGRLFGPVPLDMARLMFFTSLNEQAARYYHALLCAESPRSVIEASRWQLEVDLDPIDIPVLAFAGERDVVCPRQR